MAGLLIAILVGFSATQFHRAQQSQAQLAALQGGPVDIGFAQFMSRHHDQAIVMAQLLLADPQPSPLRPFAQSLSNTQLLELGQMRGWLHLWDAPALPSSRSMDWMLLGAAPPTAALREYLLDCQRSPTGMPGLATLEQLNLLRGLKGQDRDRRFVALMLAHHQGGLPMVEFAAREARVAAVRQLAKRILRAQAEEISSLQLMQQMLAPKA